MVSVLWVALGGFIGGASRWCRVHLLPERVAIFAGNAVASLVLGVCAHAPYPGALILGVGFAGALSTWATLARIVAEDVEAHHYGQAARTVIFNVAVCIVAAWRGIMWAPIVWS